MTGHTCLDGRWGHSFSLPPPFLKNKRATWELYQQAKSYKEKPSLTFGLRDNRWLAWQFDQAVLTWGHYVDGKLAERDAHGRPKHKLSSLLGIRAKPQPFNVGQMAAVPGLLLKG